eukprot:m.46596 g.46596  ORF g.46596 m.46596 type:complete len:541 (-) comp6312_c0_seq1:88-1710(-)
MAAVDHAQGAIAHMRYVFALRDEMGMSQQFLRVTSARSGEAPESEEHDDSAAVTELSLSFGSSFLAAAPARRDRTLASAKPSRKKTNIVYRHRQRESPAKVDIPARRWSEERDSSSLRSSLCDSLSEETNWSRLSECSFEKRRVPAPGKRGPSRISSYRSKRESCIQNPFATFNESNGDGLRESDVIRLTIFFPHAKLPSGRNFSVDMVIVNFATVADAIGLAMYLYTETQQKPPLEPDPNMYVLRMVEDDGEPDVDLPPLDSSLSISRFEFDSFCLCESPNFAAAAAASKKAPKKKGMHFVRVHHTDSGFTILQRTPHMTVAEVLDKTLKKRGLRATDYVLELVDRPGLVLNPDTNLNSLERGNLAKPLEFNLDRKFSKRRGEDDSAQPQLQGVNFTLEMYQPKTYIVSKPQKFGSHQSELVVAPDRLTISPYGKAIRFPARQKSVTIRIENVISCQALEGRRFRIEYRDDRFGVKHFDFEAKSPSDCAEIVTKVSSILRYRISDDNDSVLVSMGRTRGLSKSLRRTIHSARAPSRDAL